MTISYAITVCNEDDEAVRLIRFLHSKKRKEDNIYVLLDTPKVTPWLQDQLNKFSSNDWIGLRRSAFPGDFSQWKNELNSLCKEDYIFNIDADEMPSEHLIEVLPFVIDQGADVILVPRINIVESITDEHIQKWGWKKDENERINWPDYQWRLYKNVPYIKWINKVHERLDGFRTYALLPAEDDYALLHVKTIERQEKQNNLYEKYI
jgi:hypothetical protein